MEMAKAISTLISDDGLRQQMGKATRDRICKKFSIKACVEGYESVYTNIMTIK
jgi:glycosyltransferase involved in cell wall biosynthesis